MAADEFDAALAHLNASITGPTYSSDGSVTGSPVQQNGEDLYDPTAGMGRFDKMAAGAGSAVVDAGDAIQGWFGHGLTPEEVDLNRARQARLGGWGMAGRVLGGAAMAAPVTMAAPAVLGAAGLGEGALGALGTNAAARVAMSPIGKNALMGGAMSFLDPLGTNETHLGHALGGAALGGAFGGITNALGSAIRGPLADAVANNPYLQAIADKITPSLNQLMPRTSMWLSDNPSGMGAMAKDAQNTSEGLNGYIKKAFGYTGSGDLGDVAADAVKRAKDIYQNTNITLKGVSPTAYQQAGSLLNDALTGSNALDAPAFSTLSKRLGNFLTHLDNVEQVSGGTVPASLLKNTMSGWNAEARKGGAESMFYGQASDMLKNMLTNPGMASDSTSAAMLRDANNLYSAGKMLQSAVELKSNGGQPTLNELNTAMKGKYTQSNFMSENPDSIVGQVASLTKPMAQFKTPPNSGTTMRLGTQIAINALLGGGGAYLNNGGMQGALIGAMGANLVPAVVGKALTSNAGKNYLMHGIPGANKLLNALPPTLANGLQTSLAGGLGQFGFNPLLNAAGVAQ